MTSTKMLQILIDGQAALRREMKEGHGSLRNEMREGFKKVNKRLDMIGREVFGEGNVANISPLIE
ncbi:MAG: hypothetical protein UX25_C0004G0012 [Candidatus Woesebacteria bacterium GW2011_GWC2_45_9]|uniref:Uncharacterized protein n=1 Tax=Candidatus Woesebacteria bacterium GW2011_GWC2_45_9 TaxID=1618589 RepID=A0A0G1R9T5_9BACT|nr:MAG: hypothetical protein UX25_C0004G0012 [Candidatus Woesebacteria bacterium GW2011_GWC2_45_9]